MEPDPGRGPVTAHGTFADLQHLGDLLVCQAAEIFQFHDPRPLRLCLFQLLQCFINDQDHFVAIGDGGIDLIELDSFIVLAALLTEFSAGMVDQGLTKHHPFVKRGESGHAKHSSGGRRKNLSGKKFPVGNALKDFEGVPHGNDSLPQGQSVFRGEFEKRPHQTAVTPVVKQP